MAEIQSTSMTTMTTMAMATMTDSVFVVSSGERCLHLHTNGEERWSSMCSRLLMLFGWRRTCKFDATKSTGISSRKFEGSRHRRGSGAYIRSYLIQTDTLAMHSSHENDGRR